MSDLLPCPFCGRSDLLGFEPAERGFLSVRCRACGGQCGGNRAETEAEATATWNRRAQPAQAVPPDVDLSKELRLIQEMWDELAKPRRAVTAHDLHVWGVAMSAVERAIAQQQTRQPQAEAVPPGFVLVPVEPTEEMKDAAMAYVYKYGFTRGDGPGAVYRAMIAAAQGAKT